MVINVLIIIIVTFCLFNLVLFFFPLRIIESFTNEERVEEYIYSRKIFSNVFAGSGLTGHLPDTFYNNDVFNLYLPYSGACSAVEIVARASKVPKFLFVETNFIFKGYDRKLIKRLFSPVFFKLKFFLPCLLKKHQIFFMLKQLIKVLKRGNSTKKKSSLGLDYQQLTQFQNFYNQQFNPRQLDNEIKELKKYIDYLTARGCKVIFFEMPIESTLADSLLARHQKVELKKMFPENNYTWIEPGAFNSYDTEDGIHLTEESAFRYFTYLDREWCKKNQGHKLFNS